MCCKAFLPGYRCFDGMEDMYVNHHTCGYNYSCHVHAVSCPFVSLQCAVGVLGDGRISIPETRNFRLQYRHVVILA